ncbi:MAG: AAA family ATPase [Brevinema sp.]
MLISFTMQGYRSYNNRQMLSFLPLEKSIEDKSMDSFIYKDDNIRLLKIGAIYGANASGKTNILLALRAIFDFSLNFLPANYSFSSELDKTNVLNKDECKVPYIPFLNEVKECAYIIEVYSPENGKSYKYSIDLGNQGIVKESLEQKKGDYHKSEYVTIFERSIHKDDINIQYGIDDEQSFKSFSKLSRNREFKNFINHSLHSFQTGLGLLIRAGGEDFKEFARAFSDVIVRISDFSTQSILGKSLSDHIANRNGIHQTIINFIKIADPQVEDIVIDDKSKHPDFYYLINDKNIKIRYPDLSEGSKKLYMLSGDLLKIMWQGGVLAVDEIDSTLHPFVTALVLEELCKNEDFKGQVIFTAHSTTIIDFFNRSENQRLPKESISLIFRSEKAESEIKSYISLEDNGEYDRSGFSSYMMKNRFLTLPHSASWFIEDFTNINRTDIGE